MVTWLRRVFIKDYQSLHDPNVRAAHGVLSAWVGIVLNFILFSLKIASGLYMAAKSHWVFSMALLGDGLNNLFDFSSSIITLVGFSLSKKPADEKHPFGHERAEYIAGMFIGGAILISSAILLFRSIEGAIAHETVEYDILAFVALGLTLPLKAIQSGVNFSLAKLLHSDTLRSVAMDSFIDMTVSTLIFIAAIICKSLGYPGIDAYLGIALALFLGYNGINALRLSSDTLLGSPMREGLEDEVRDIALSHSGILGVHDILCHSYGENANYVSLHAELDGSLSLDEAHRIVDEVETDLRNHIHAEIVIHADPVDLGDEKLTKLKEQVGAILKNLDPELSFHDLRIIKEDGGDVLRLEILLPFHHDSDLEDKIHEALKPLGMGLNISFDHPFSAAKQ